MGFLIKTNIAITGPSEIAPSIRHFYPLKEIPMMIPRFSDSNGRFLRKKKSSIWEASTMGSPSGQGIVQPKKKLRRQIIPLKQ